MASASWKEFKEEFYEWCGLLSIDEIIANANLIGVIERVQRILLSPEA